MRPGPPWRGYYSFELGAWHFISLNSNVAADVDSAQVAWLHGGTYGVLRMTLRAGSYDWEFIPQPDATFTDRGFGHCVDVG
jgi:hypothetical protein